MKKLIFIISIYFLFLAQACTSLNSKHQDTIEPSILDGAWLITECKCNSKVLTPSEMQIAHTLFINGNVLIQQQMVRWKKPEWNRYCSVNEESKIKNISDDTFEVTRVSERSFSPSETKCDIPETNPVRTWKIISLNSTELNYESTNGCESGPMFCVANRLDH